MLSEEAGNMPESSFSYITFQVFSTVAQRGRYVVLEGEVTRRLRKALAEHPRLKDVALVQRHVNYYVSGVLDMSVSVGQFTLWIELKMLGRELTKLQAHNVKRLRRGAMVVTFSKNGKEAIIADIAIAGWLSFEQVVEEIVGRCLDNSMVITAQVRELIES